MVTDHVTVEAGGFVACYIDVELSPPIAVPKNARLSIGDVASCNKARSSAATEPLKPRRATLGPYRVANSRCMRAT